MIVRRPLPKSKRVWLMTKLNTKGRRPLAARALLLFVALAILGEFNASFGNFPQTKRNGNHRDAVLLHTYETGFATEIANTIPVSAAQLLPLLPAGYELVPAA